jgi:hypothetical protein
MGSNPWTSLAELNMLKTFPEVSLPSSSFLSATLAGGGSCNVTAEITSENYDQSPQMPLDANFG